MPSLEGGSGKSSEAFVVSWPFLLVGTFLPPENDVVNRVQRANPYDRHFYNNAVSITDFIFCHVCSVSDYEW